MGNEVMTVEVPEATEPTTEETVPVSAEEALESGLSPEEVKMAEDHGLIEKPQDGEGDEKPATDKEEGTSKKADQETEKTPKEIADEEFKAMTEDPEKEHESLKKFNKNEQAMYFLRKKDRTRRQAAENERDLLKIKNNHFEEKLSSLEADIKKIAEMRTADPDKSQLDIDLDDPDVTDGMSKEEINALLDQREEDKTTRQAEADAVRKEKAKVLNKRLDANDVEARTKYDDFDAVTDIAIEYIKKVDKTRHAYHTVVKAIADPEQNSAEVLYSFGKFHPQFAELLAEAKKIGAAGSEGQKMDGNKINKMVDNASKRTGSAKIGGSTGGGSRKVSVDDLTAADVVSMSQAEYNKLPKHVRDRLLQGG